MTPPAHNWDHRYSIAERVKALPAKIRARGWKWVIDRLSREWRMPTTPAGRLLRGIMAAVFNGTNAMMYPVVRWWNRGVLLAVYDLEVQPVTYDICTFLASAEVERVARKLKYIRLLIVPGFDGLLRAETEDYEKVVGHLSRARRLYSILLPVAGLLPSCWGITLAATRAEARRVCARVPHQYPCGYNSAMPTATDQKDWIAASRRGDIAVLRAQPHARQMVEARIRGLAGSRAVITITLRQYGFMMARNSNAAAWRSFVDSLDPERFFVVILPDVEDLGAGADDFGHARIMNEFAVDPGLRIALYEVADLNLGINNGPMALCYLNAQVRYVMFKIITNGVPQSDQSVFLRHGPMPGEQPSFLRQDYQRWVWEDDTEEAIRRETEPFIAKLK